MIHGRNNLSNSRKILLLKTLQERIMDEVIKIKLLPPSHQGQYIY